MISKARNRSRCVPRLLLVAMVLGSAQFSLPTPQASAQSLPQASAESVTLVPNDWPLKPLELSHGDRFRLVFLTSTTRNAMSSDINDYHTFVQERAENGHHAIRSHSNAFRALVSTAGTDARTATQTTGLGGDPMYWLNGDKLAHSPADFYDGTWASVRTMDEVGREVRISSSSSLQQGHVFTGSNADGSTGNADGKYYTVGPYKTDLTKDGGSAIVGYIDRESQNSSSPIKATNSPRNWSRSNSLQFYAVSLPFQVKPTITISALGSTLAGVSEGETINFTLTTNGSNGWGGAQDVNVRVVGDPAGLVDPDDRDQTIRATSSPQTHDVTLQTLVDPGSSSGTVTIEIVAGDSYEIGAASKIEIPVTNEPVYSGRLLEVEGASATEGKDLRFTLSWPSEFQVHDSLIGEVKVSAALGGGLHDYRKCR